jgi:hypothetical protein
MRVGLLRFVKTVRFGAAFIHLFVTKKRNKIDIICCGK